MDISEDKGFICPFCNNIFIVPKKESESTVICPKCKKIVSQQASSQSKETTTAQRPNTQQTQTEPIQEKQDKEVDIILKNLPPIAPGQKPQKVDLTKDFRGSSSVGKTCPYCQAPIKPGVAVKVCLACNIPHHTECWRENGGCTTYGCQQAKAEGQGPVQRQQGETRFCSSCGTQVSAQERFCSGCGLAVGQTGAPAGPSHSQNTSGQGSSSVLPPELAGWNWGAFFWNWIWAIGNNVWIGLLALIPYVNFIMIFVLGAKGNEWAWQNKRWDNVEHFRRVQRGWVKAVWFYVIIILIVIAIVLAVAMSQ